MDFLPGLILIAAPTWIYAWLMRRVDRYEHEPVRYLAAAFAWGAIPAVIFAVIVQVVLAVPVNLAFGEASLSAELTTTAFIAPVVEEILKGAAVAAIYAWRRREFDGWIDGIVYGSTVGFGFAFVENIGYLAGTSSLEEWWTLYFLRVLVLGFMHGFWTSLIGIGFGVARRRSGFVASASIVLGLAAAIASHVVHNASVVLAQFSDGATILFTAANYLFMLALIVGLSWIGRRRERAIMRTHLRDEAPEVLPSPAFEALTIGRGRRLPRPLVQAAAELALAKRRAAAADELDALRENLRRVAGGR